METSTLRPGFVIEFPVAQEDAAPAAGSSNDDDLLRSERNIRQWASYLPAECVRTMILMGWDVST